MSQNFFSMAEYVLGLHVVVFEIILLQSRLHDMLEYSCWHVLTREVTLRRKRLSKKEKSEAVKLQPSD